MYQKPAVQKKGPSKRFFFNIFIVILVIIVYQSFISESIWIDKNTSQPPDSPVREDSSSPDQAWTAGQKKSGKSGARKTSNNNYRALRSNLQKYLDDQEGTYGIYFINLTTGQKFGINDTEEFIGASTIKIPINLYLYRMTAGNKLSLDERLTFEEEDYEEGTGNLQYEDFGETYPLRELSRLSIEVSDNVATNMLLRYLGIENVKNHMKQLGGRYTSYEENTTCPRDMSLYMKSVYDFYKNNQDYGNELMSYFKNTEFHDRIPALLPSSVEVAHKIGTQVSAVHDIGIVFAESPFILSVMSKDVVEEEAPEIIANIARMVYDFVVE